MYKGWGGGVTEEGGTLCVCLRSLPYASVCLVERLCTGEWQYAGGAVSEQFDLLITK